MIERAERAILDAAEAYRLVEEVNLLRARAETAEQERGAADSLARALRRDVQELTAERDAAKARAVTAESKQAVAEDREIMVSEMVIELRATVERLTTALEQAVAALREFAESVRDNARLWNEQELHDAAERALLAQQAAERDSHRATVERQAEQLAAAVDALRAYQAYADLLVLGWKPMAREKAEALKLWDEVERLTAVLAEQPAAEPVVVGDPVVACAEYAASLRATGVREDGFVSCRCGFEKTAHAAQPAAERSP